MQFLAILTGVLILMTLSGMYESNKRKGKLRIRIKERFGKKPEKAKYDYEKIGYYWQEHSKSHSIITGSYASGKSTFIKALYRKRSTCTFHSYMYG